MAQRIARTPARIQPIGDAAVTAVLGDAFGRSVQKRVWSLHARLQQLLGDTVLDIVPAYASVMVRFDPATVPLATVMATMRGALEDEHPVQLPEAPVMQIAVDFSPDKGLDLDTIAEHTGLARDQVIALFCSGEYTVAFLGFTAGFPYLIGVPPRLFVPRLPSPRARVPAGSVAIAAGQAGIYPRATPGGWRILGRTNTQIFDPLRNPPCLLQPGQRVHFHPAGARPEKPVEAGGAAHRVRGFRESSIPSAELAIEMLEPGILTTVQDNGRRHVGVMGVSPAGWADWFSGRVANRLVGNPQSTAVLEVTLTGCAFRALTDLVVAVTGAAADLTVDGVPKALWRSHVAPRDSVVRIGPAQCGARSYVAVRGGFAVPPILGSCSTDVGCAFGGFEGRSLRRGDRLCKVRPEPASPKAVVLRQFSETLRPKWTHRVGLRVVPGMPWMPGSVSSTDVMGRLTAQTFKVSPVGNRQGVRLEGQPLPGGEAFSVLSTGMSAGCVQMTSEGLPIILLAEHQTTGGYAVPFVVISADLPRCGQLRTGDEVTFRQVTLAQASHALAEVMRDANAPLAEVPA